VIHVVAEIRLVPGTLQQFLAEFGRLAPEVRAEDGCIEYAGAVDFPSGASVQAPVRDDLVTVIEKWRDVAALEAHGSARHMAAYRKRVAGFVKATTVYVLRPVGEPG
jgi:quinol monooxygenase YgiN